MGYIISYLLLGMLTLLIDYLELYNEENQLIITISDVMIGLMVIMAWPIALIGKTLNYFLPIDEITIFTFKKK